MSKPVPFSNAEEAWFWTTSALVAQQEGTRFVARRKAPVRPCEPDDVVRCLDRLYRARRIDLAHLRILRIWGERGEAPSQFHPREKYDFHLWREALDRLEGLLWVKGIVSNAAEPKGVQGQVVLLGQATDV